MSARFVLVLMAMSMLFSADAAFASSKKQSTKQTAHSSSSKSHAVKRKHRSGRQIAHHLIPPPPAYTPAFLPESYYYRFANNTQPAVEIEEEEGTEKIAAKPKPVYVRYYGDAYRPSQTRGGVSNF